MVCPLLFPTLCPMSYVDATVCPIVSPKFCPNDLDVEACLEPFDPPAVRALVLEDTGVRPGLSHPGQLLVPLELHHVGGCRLGGGATRHQGPQSVVLVQSNGRLSLNKEMIWLGGKLF